MKLSILALFSNIAAENFLSRRHKQHLTPITDASNPDYDLNETPVIGILSQELSESMKKDPRFEGYKSYMMADYPQYVMAQGSRVVPLVYEEPEELTLSKMSKIDGVLFPGGEDAYRTLGMLVFNEIKRLNDEGTFMPLLAICQGFEYMAQFTATCGDAALTNIRAENVSLPLEYTVDPSDTRFYGGLGDDAYDFERHPFTYNAHNLGVSPDLYVSDNGLNSFWDLTAIGHVPDNGTEPMAFIASFEAKHYPIYATQYHPEKPSQLWTHNDINHDWRSI